MSSSGSILKIAFAVLAVALASTASAGGWRSLRLDATSEAAFEQSVALFQHKLSPSRRHAFARALQDIWTEGVLQASGVYTRADYFARLNGLAYEEVVTVLDPTGEKAHQYRAEYYATRVDRGNQRATWSGSETPWPSPTGGPPPVQNGEYRGATRSIDRQTH